MVYERPSEKLDRNTKLTPEADALAEFQWQFSAHRSTGARSAFTHVINNMSVRTLTETREALKKERKRLLTLLINLDEASATIREHLRGVEQADPDERSLDPYTMNDNQL